MTHTPLKQRSAREQEAAGVTQARLKEVLDYNPETGVFTRIKSKRGDWVGKAAGSLDRKGYVLMRLFGKYYRAHRLAFLWMTGAWPAEQVDHINGVRDDNRWCNLREANQSENSQNQGVAKRTNRLGLLGVRWHTIHKKFEARITKNGKTVAVGYYPTPEQAHAAYLAAKKELHTHNERALQNDPHPTQAANS